MSLFNQILAALSLLLGAGNHSSLACEVMSSGNYIRTDNGVVIIDTDEL